MGYHGSYAEEYDLAAEWCALNGVDWRGYGDPLPESTCSVVRHQIASRPEEFAETVRRHAYRLAMEHKRIHGERAEEAP